MAKKILKAILKYPIMSINRIYTWIYYRLNKNKLDYDLIGDEKKNILVLAPHVDDETIGLGGTIIKYNRLGGKMSLIYLTDGRGSTSHKSIEDTISERRQEGIKIKDSYGFENVYFLDAIDGSLDSKDINITNKIFEILESENPDVIFSPFIIDGNADHVETTKALSIAIKRWNMEFEDINLYGVNTIIHPKLINRVSLLDKTTYKEKLEKYDIFASQWAMDFGIFHLLDIMKAKMFKEGFAAEVFIKINYQVLDEIIQEFDKDGFKPEHFRQISSEFTLIPAIIKSRKYKTKLNKLVESIIKNKKLGGSF